jgi:hypothetical protein
MGRTLIVQRIARHPYRGWGLAALAVLAFSLAVVVAALQERTGAPMVVTVAGGIGD